MVSYDGKVIVAFAEQLYKQAASVVATYTVVGILAGLGLGYFLSGALGIHPILEPVLAAAIVGAVAYVVGQQRAFALRLQAQVALCQIQIEANTRVQPGVSSHG
jgi:hypothetical protein